MTHQGGQTFRQHLIALADALGIQSFNATTGLADVPENAYELDKLKRKYNEGLRLMGTSKPSGWYALRPVVNVTIDTDTLAPGVIDGDTSRYRLPAWCSGQPVGEWSWIQGDGGSLEGKAQSKSWGDVTNMLTFEDSGVPCIVAVMPYHENTPDGTTRSVWQLRVAPRPNQAYTLSATFNVSVVPLTELDDRHPFGALHDEAVLAAAKWSFVKDDTTDARHTVWKDDFYGADGTGDTSGRLFDSKRIDDEGAPLQIASLLDGVGGYGRFQIPPPVSIINGVTVSS